MGLSNTACSTYPAWFKEGYTTEEVDFMKKFYGDSLSDMIDAAKKVERNFIPIEVNYQAFVDHGNILPAGFDTVDHAGLIQRALKAAMGFARKHAHDLKVMGGYKCYISLVGPVDLSQELGFECALLWGQIESHGSPVTDTEYYGMTLEGREIWVSCYYDLQAIHDLFDRKNPLKPCDSAFDPCLSG